MDINICENLKKLRRDKGNTQEELAEFLGISMQAVSKWERSEGYPDITLLLKIAAYYDVTVDELLGVGEIKKQEQVKEILERQKRNANIGDTNANVELMRKAIKEFPNDYQIIHGLMHSLFSCDCKDPGYINEVIKLGERIVSNCTDDDIRYSALQLICFSYSGLKNYDKAQEYANKLPGYECTRNAVLTSILKGDELLVYTQDNLMNLVDEIYLNVICMLRAKGYSDEEKIHAYQAVVRFYELLFEDGNFGFYNCRLAFLYRFIARIYARHNNREMTLKNIGLSAKHAIAFDTIKEQHQLTAPLVNSIVYIPSENSQNWIGTHSKLLLDSLADECFNFCREDVRFKEIAADLNNYV